MSGAQKPFQSSFKSLDDQFLGEMIEQAKVVIRWASSQTDNPLVIQFSGGKDSMAMVGLTQEVTSNFVLGFMETGIEFPEAIEFVKSSADKLGVTLHTSTPADHLGGFFERLEKFRRFPSVKAQWCNRDLKVRPQQKMLRKIYGSGALYKVVGVRRFESVRRRYLYGKNEYVRPDNQVSRDYNIYPILNWTNNDVLRYLKLKRLPTSSLYKKYKVSGCYWCPFYGLDIYRPILKDNPDLYDEFIKWEDILGEPSVIDHVYLRDLKGGMYG